MKNIIKRILVGVGIALILMLIKDHGLILKASAKSYNVVPNELRLTYTNTNGNTNTTNYTTLNSLTPTRYPYNTFYGRDSINANYRVEQMLFRLETTSSMKSGFYDLNFLFYNNADFNGDVQEPYSFNIRNNSRIFVCSSDDSGTPYNSTLGKDLIGVKCSNIYLDLENNNVVYAMIMPSDVVSAFGSAYGISAVTFQYDAINSNVDIGKKIDETNDTLKDETAPDTNNLFENNDTGDLSNSPVSDLITMPISLLQAINNNASSSCSTWNLGSLLGTNLLLPCINLQEVLGSHLYNLIDMAICLFLAYNIGLLCITIYNNVISLNDDFDNMYSPKHSYHGRHEEGSATD